MGLFSWFKKTKRLANAFVELVPTHEYVALSSEEKFKRSKQLFEKYNDERTLNLSMALLKESADEGFKRAQVEMGIFLSDSLIFEPDYPLAIKYFEMAALSNDGEACFNLGILYMNGTGVNKNIEKSFDYFNKSAELNFPLGIHQIGAFYLEGLFVEENYSKAIQYFKRACDLNCVVSLVTLANIYYNEKRDEESYMLMNKAAELGSKEAVEYLEDEVYDKFKE